MGRKYMHFLRFVGERERERERERESIGWIGHGKISPVTEAQISKYLVKIVQIYRSNIYSLEINKSTSLLLLDLLPISV